MKIEIPHIVRPLHLGAYASELEGVSVQVWVNPPREMLARRFELVKQSREATEQAELERIGAEMIAWYAELWSQGPEDTRWSVEDVNTLIEQMNDTDPGLWVWLTGQSQEMIVAHRQQKKKA